MSASYDNVLAEIKELSVQQQRQLRDKLDEWLTVTDGTVNKLHQMLIEAGFMNRHRTEAPDTGK
jgi:hypothetical protein